MGKESVERKKVGNCAVNEPTRLGSSLRLAFEGKGDKGEPYQWSFCCKYLASRLCHGFWKEEPSESDVNLPVALLYTRSTSVVSKGEPTNVIDCIRMITGSSNMHWN